MKETIKETINIKSARDAEKYINHLAKIAKEVDQWSQEKKKESIFYKELNKNKDIE